MEKIINGLIIAAALMTVEEWERSLAAFLSGKPIEKWVHSGAWNSAQAILEVFERRALAGPGAPILTNEDMMSLVHTFH